jgi:hypothetical protein
VTQTVLRLESSVGSPRHVNHGNFWPTPQTDIGSAFWWDAWVKPLAAGGGVYFVSDGYGGNHAMLWGVGGGAAQSGNVYNGSTAISFAGTYLTAIGEWVHLAVAWDGTTIRTFVNGVCDSELAFAGPRKSVGGTGGGNILYIGGSDHQCCPCDIAMVRCWDRGDPRINQHVWAFVPPRWLATENDQMMPVDFACDYTVPAHVLQDLSPMGVECSGGPQLQASVTKTASFNGAAVDLNGRAPLPGGTKARLLITAASGTLPTLDVKIQQSDDGSTNWADLVTFDQMAATGQQSVTLQPRKRYLRASVTIAGTLPSFTYEVQAQLPPQRHPGRIFDASQVTDVISGFGLRGIGTWPGWVVDNTCPFGQMIGSTLPDETIPSPAAVPGSALAFDSFGRRNQTFAFQLTPDLGSTEGGSLGALAWQYGNPASASPGPLWGILQGRAVQLSSALAAIAYVPLVTANQDIRVNRSKSSPSVPETGIAFRVQDRQNYWWAYMRGGIVWVGKIVAGSNTDVANYTAASSWDTLRVVANGTTITVYVDNGSGGWTQLGQLTGQASLQSAQGGGIASYAGVPSWAHSGARYGNWTAFAG